MCDSDFCRCGGFWGDSCRTSPGPARKEPPRPTLEMMTARRIQDGIGMLDAHLKLDGLRWELHLTAEGLLFFGSHLIEGRRVPIEFDGEERRAHRPLMELVQKGLGRTGAKRGTLLLDSDDPVAPDGHDLDAFGFELTQHVFGASFLPLDEAMRSREGASR